MFFFFFFFFFFFCFCFFFNVPHDGVLPCRRYVARACGHWPFSRLSGSRCWLAVHQYQSPSASWYEGVHKVYSNDWAVGATPQWPDGDPVQGPHVPRIQSGAFSRTRFMPVCMKQHYIRFVRSTWTKLNYNLRGSQPPSLKYRCYDLRTKRPSFAVVSVANQNDGDRRDQLLTLVYHAIGATCSRQFSLVLSSHCE